MNHCKVSELEEGEIRSDLNINNRDSEIMLVEKPNLLLAALKSDSKASVTKSASCTLS